MTSMGKHFFVCIKTIRTDMEYIKTVCSLFPKLLMKIYSSFLCALRFCMFVLIKDILLN